MYYTGVQLRFYIANGYVPED